VGDLRVLQINVNGWRARRVPLDRLLEECNVHVAVLLETKLHERVTAPVPKGWSMQRLDRAVHRVSTGERTPAQGGVAILVRNGIRFEPLPSPLPADSTVEVLGVRVSSERSSIDIWALYRAPVSGIAADGRDGCPLIERWPSGPRTLLCADVNSHDVSWDPGREPDAIGCAITDWMNDNSMCVLNSGTPTRFNPAGGGGSAPDLTAAGATLAPRCQWSTLDPIGSDHVPLLTVVESVFTSAPTQPEARLNLRKADWEIFQAVVSERLVGFGAEDGSLTAAIKRFNNALLAAARAAAPSGSVRQPKAWWSPACREAHRASLHAFRRMCAGRPGAAAEYAAARQEADAVYHREKQQSWRNYTATLDVRTAPSRVWRTLRAMDGRTRHPLPDTPIYVAGKAVHDVKAKANAAIAHYAGVSRLQIPRRKSKEAYLQIRRHIARGVGTDPQASPFSAAELSAALHSGGGKSPGADGIHPQLLLHLPKVGREALLALCNRSWLTGEVPAVWKSALIVPILKKGKPAKDVRSYRPVSLLPCAAKLLERMVMARLDHWQRSVRLVPSEQAGFQPGRSTVDCIAQIAQPAFDAL
jgi:hypothetical protein